MNAGDRIGEGGRYQLTRQLGMGAMGIVYLAQDSRMHKQVVVKMLNPTYASNHSVRERFRNEALIQANLQHENVVRATDIIESGDLLAIVMEFVNGPSLEQYLIEMGGILPLARIAEIMDPVLQSIEYAHSRGVVHRDLKPANILLDRSTGREIPRVADFGIAKILSDSGAGMTREGSVLGTPSYMAPEQLKGQRDIDNRTDVYALGAILYQLATGRLPYDAGTEYETTYLILSGQRPPPPSTVVPGIPPQFDAVVARAMAADRDQRYPSAGMLRAELTTVLQSGFLPQQRFAPAPAARTVLEEGGPGPAAYNAPMAASTAFESAGETGYTPNSGNRRMLIIGGAIAGSLLAVVLVIVAVATLSDEGGSPEKGGDEIAMLRARIEEANLREEIATRNATIAEAQARERAEAAAARAAQARRADSSPPVRATSSASGGVAPSPSRPWVVIVGSFKQENPGSRQEAERRVQKLRDAGFTEAKVYDGREFPNFRCCFWTPIVGAFATSQEAKALERRIKEAGIDGAYVKPAYK